MSQYFPEPFKRSDGKCRSSNIKFELDLSNYAAKANLKKKQALTRQI